jgi:hypothetical protein
MTEAEIKCADVEKCILDTTLFDSHTILHHRVMSPSPTVTDPSAGEKKTRGDHWADGSGQNFRNPWPSFQDRVSYPPLSR